MGKTEKTGKKNRAAKATKIPKTKRRKYGMNETCGTSKKSNCFVKKCLMTLALKYIRTCHTPKKNVAFNINFIMYIQDNEFMVTKHKLGDLIGSDRSAHFIFSQSKQISFFCLL